MLGFGTVSDLSFLFAAGFYMALRPRYTPSISEHSASTVASLLPYSDFSRLRKLSLYFMDTLQEARWDLC